jgi:hypothetical protein
LLKLSYCRHDTTQHTTYRRSSSPVICKAFCCGNFLHQNHQSAVAALGLLFPWAHFDSDAQQCCLIGEWRPALLLLLFPGVIPSFYNLSTSSLRARCSGTVEKVPSCSDRARQRCRRSCAKTRPTRSAPGFVCIISLSHMAECCDAFLAARGKFSQLPHRIKMKKIYIEHSLTIKKM